MQFSSVRFLWVNQNSGHIQEKYMYVSITSIAVKWNLSFELFKIRNISKNKYQLHNNNYGIHEVLILKWTF